MSPDVAQVCLKGSLERTIQSRQMEPVVRRTRVLGRVYSSAHKQPSQEPLYRDRKTALRESVTQEFVTPSSPGAPMSWQILARGSCRRHFRANSPTLQSPKTGIFLSLGS